jgi:ribonuclease P protein component
VLVGRRAALHRDFATMLDDLRQALLRLDRQPAKPAKALSSEASRQENASKDKATGASRNPN